MDLLNYMLCFYSSDIWSVLSTIFTGIAVLAIILALMQLRFDAWLKAQELFTEKEFVKARGIVYKLKGQEYDLWIGNKLESALLVCRKMDELAHLRPYLWKKKFFNTWDNPIAKSWMILEDFVKYERSEDKADWDKKWLAFETIGKKAVESIKKVN